MQLVKKFIVPSSADLAKIAGKISLEKNPGGCEASDCSCRMCGCF